MNDGTLETCASMERRLFRRLPLSWVARWAGDPPLPLVYHLVRAVPSSSSSADANFKTVEQFDSDLCFLKKHFRFLHYPDWIRSQGAHPKLPSGTTLLTFDDGFVECFTVVRPILLRHGVPAVFFIPTALVNTSEATRRTDSSDSERYLSLDHIRQLAADGFTIGAHSCRHQRFDAKPREAWVTELVESCRLIQTWTGQEHVPFAFPFDAVPADAAGLERLLYEHSFIRGLFGKPPDRTTRSLLIARLRADDPAPSAALPLRYRQLCAQQLYPWLGDPRPCSLLKGTIRQIAPDGARRAAKRAARRLIYLGRMRYCPVCGSSVRMFLPFGIPERPDALCPVCRSLERHRLLWLYMKQKTNLFDGKPKKMLHLAPEECLTRHLERVANLDYLTADLMMPNVKFKLDITSIPFPDNSFDIILSSHVLLHIPDDLRAMRELCRILKPDGWAILHEGMARPRTVEDPNLKTPEERQALYGNPTFFRLYGADYPERLRQAGFDVRTDNYAAEFRPEEVQRMGFGDESMVLFCTKRISSPPQDGK